MNPEDGDPAVRRRQDLNDEHTTAWEQTLEEAKHLVEERQQTGWKSSFVVSAHTNTVSKDMSNQDRFGLVHIIPDNYVDILRDVFDPDAFTDDLIYGSSVNGVMFVAIELVDTETERSVVIPCSYDMTRAHGMTESAAEEGALYSHFETITGDPLGVFRHETVEPLVTPPGT